jgi:hypothetical protein
MIDKLALKRGVFYEGDSQDLRVVTPTPVVSEAHCGFVETTGGMKVIFREDSFDPVTRVKRGRLYVGGPLGDSWPPGRVDDGPYHPYPANGGSASPGVRWTAEQSFNAWNPSVSPEKVLGQTMALGSAAFLTRWRVVGVERVMVGHILLTLRAISLIGVVPELTASLENKDRGTVDPAPVRQALDSLVDALHKQQPIPIVDVARETAKVLLTAWIGSVAHGKDLAEVIDDIPARCLVTRSAASIVNRFHSRGKSAAQEKHATKGLVLRDIVEADAESSVHLVALLMREMGWAAT